MILTIEASTAQELASKVRDLAGCFGQVCTDKVTYQGHRANDSSNLENPATSNLSGEATPSPAPEKVSKRGRRSNAEIAAASSTASVQTEAPQQPPATLSVVASKVEASDPTETAEMAAMTGEAAVTVPEASTVPTREQTELALKAVVQSKGMPAARDILTKMKATRISEVQAEKYPEFIRLCHEALGTQAQAQA